MNLLPGSMFPLAALASTGPACLALESVCWSLHVVWEHERMVIAHRAHRRYGDFRTTASSIFRAVKVAEPAGKVRLVPGRKTGAQRQHDQVTERTTDEGHMTTIDRGIDDNAGRGTTDGWLELAARLLERDVADLRARVGRTS